MLTVSPIDRLRSEWLLPRLKKNRPPKKSGKTPQSFLSNHTRPPWDPYLLTNLPSSLQSCSTRPHPWCRSQVWPTNRLMATILTQTHHIFRLMPLLFMAPPTRPCLDRYRVTRTVAIPARTLRCRFSQATIARYEPSHHAPFLSRHQANSAFVRSATHYLY